MSEPRRPESHRAVSLSPVVDPYEEFTEYAVDRDLGFDQPLEAGGGAIKSGPRSRRGAVNRLGEQKTPWPGTTTRSPVAQARSAKEVPPSSPTRSSSIKSPVRPS